MYYVLPTEMFWQKVASIVYVYHHEKEGKIEERRKKRRTIERCHSSFVCAVDLLPVCLSVPQKKSSNLGVIDGKRQTDRQTDRQKIWLFSKTGEIEERKSF